MPHSISQHPSWPSRLLLSNCRLWLIYTLFENIKRLILHPLIRQINIILGLAISHVDWAIKDGSLVIFVLIYYRLFDETNHSCRNMSGFVGREKGNQYQKYILFDSQCNYNSTNTKSIAIHILSQTAWKCT